MQPAQSRSLGAAEGRPARATFLKPRARVAVLLLCAGCAVDERTLTSNPTGNEGGSRSSMGPAGAPGNIAGAAGELEPAPLPRCIYSTAESEAGCETLVKNAGFASNVASWQAENFGVSEGWLNADANDDPKSGSLVVMNLNYSDEEAAKAGTAGGGARQCIPITSGRTYDLAADVFIPSGQGLGFEGRYVSSATLSVFYYSAAECAGQTIANFTSSPVSKTDEWVHLEGSTRAPKESQSMAVRLATLKPFRQYMFEAHFDNVFVRMRGVP